MRDKQINFYANDQAFAIVSKLPWGAKSDFISAAIIAHNEQLEQAQTNCDCPTNRVTQHKPHEIEDCRYLNPCKCDECNGETWHK